MKKLFALSWVFMFLVSAAFAEVTVGGSVVGNWHVLSSDTTDDSDVYTVFSPRNGGAFNAVRGRIDVTATNEEGTFGGWIEARVNATAEALVSGWWKPLDPLKITYGYLFGGANPIGVALADDDILPIQFYGRSANYIPWGYEVLNGAHLELTPLKGLYILASVPLDNSGNLSYNGGTPYVAGKDGATAGEIFQHTMARVAYTFDSIGTARLTFAGGTGRGLRPLDKDKGTYEDLLSAPTLANTDASVLDLGFTFSGVENLAVDLGVEIPLPALSWSTISDPNPNNTPQNITEGSDVSSQVPYAVNLRANFTSGAFSIAGGVSGKFAGKFTTTPAGGDESAYEQGIIVGATLNPAFDAGIAVVGLVGELNFNGEDKKSVGSTTTTYDSTVNYNVIPYVQKTIGGASVYAGVQIGSTNQAKDPVDGKVSWDSYITWSIPLGFTYSF